MSHLALALEQAKAAAREVVDESTTALIERIEALEARLDSVLGSEPPADPPADGDAPAARKRAPRRKAASAPEADLPAADTDAPE